MLEPVPKIEKSHSSRPELLPKRGAGCSSGGKSSLGSTDVSLMLKFPSRSALCALQATLALHELERGSSSSSFPFPGFLRQTQPPHFTGSVTRNFGSFSDESQRSFRAWARAYNRCLGSLHCVVNVRFACSVGHHLNLNRPELRNLRIQYRPVPAPRV